MMTVLAWLATLLSAVYAAALLRRYADRRHPAYLIWGFGLAFFAVGSGAEAWAGLTAGFLGVGTLLLAAPRAGRVALSVAVALGLLILWQTAVAPVDVVRLAQEGFRAIDRPALLRLPVAVMSLGPTVRGHHPAYDPVC
jgi:hypothetical protein